MNKTKLFGIAALVLLLANVFLLYTLMGGKPKPNRGPKTEIIRMLHFDKQQADDYELLIKKHHDEIRPLEMKMFQLKSDFYNQLNTNNESEKDSIAALIGQTQIKIESANYQHFEEIKKLCKPEQMSYFTEFAAKVSEMFEVPRNRKRPEH